MGLRKDNGAVHTILLFVRHTASDVVRDGFDDDIRLTVSDFAGSSVGIIDGIKNGNTIGDDLKLITVDAVGLSL